MALSKAKKSDIPKDAVLLNENQAIEHQWEIIENWKNSDDVWLFKYGPGFLGALSGLTGLLINNHYRNRFRLGNSGHMVSYIPIVALPAMMSALLHRAFIQPRILIQKDKCFVCLQTRALVLQNVLGMAYPAVLAPLASYMLAIRHYTYRIPSLLENPKGVFNIYKKMTTPITTGLVIGFLVHSALVTFITMKETECVFNVHSQLRKMEQEYDDLAAEMRSAISKHQSS